MIFEILRHLTTFLRNEKFQISIIFWKKRKRILKTIQSFDEHCVCVCGIDVLIKTHYTDKRSTIVFGPSPSLFRDYRLHLQQLFVAHVHRFHVSHGWQKLKILTRWGVHTQRKCSDLGAAGEWTALGGFLGPSRASVQLFRCWALSPLLTLALLIAVKKRALSADKII